MGNYKCSLCMYLNSKCTRLCGCSVVSDSVAPWTIVVHGIFQARILQWVAISFSRGSSWPRDQTRISCISRIDRYTRLVVLKVQSQDQKQQQHLGTCEERPYRAPQLESLKLGPSHPCINMPSRWFWCLFKFENHCIKPSHLHIPTTSQ